MANSNRQTHKLEGQNLRVKGEERKKRKKEQK